MTKKWNLQDIRPAQPRRSRAPRPTDQNNDPVSDQSRNENLSDSYSDRTSDDNTLNITIEDGAKKSRKRLIISIIIFVVIVGSAIGISALTGKTELTIYPVNREPNVSAEFTAYPDKRDGALSYEIMTLETTGESQVTATGQVEVEEQASGTIEIIKTTPGSERLIKNTRFRSPDGLVYRIQESVVVPGSVTDSDGASVPGTIQAEVFADETGDEYNIGSGVEFDIPGFQEGGFTELYNSISARSVTEFTGGFSGPQFQIDPDELSTARQALQVELRDNLLMRIESEKPADFIAFPGSVAITYNELPAVEYGDDLVTIKEQAVLQVPLFNTIEFGSFIASETIATYDGGDVRVDNPEALTFDYTSATTSSSVIANATALEFRLTGEPLLIWEYDEESLTRDLAGLPKTAINNAITAYPGISAAKVRITPFWQRTFPEAPEDITIIETLDEIE